MSKSSAHLRQAGAPTTKMHRLSIARYELAHTPAKLSDGARKAAATLNNAAERAVRCVAVGRKNWTFAGSDAGGHRAAAVYSLVQTCKLNDVDPQAWLADVLARLPDYPANKIADLLPWNWQAARLAVAA
jgi:hypothetical protein